MVKFITKMMSITLIMVACSWSANAQEVSAKKINKGNESIFVAKHSRSTEANCNQVRDAKSKREGHSVTLNWTAPAPPQQLGYITYSAEEPAYSIGSQSQAWNTHVAALFMPGDLADLNGCKLTKFKYYCTLPIEQTAQTLIVWTGGTTTTPGPQVWSHVIVSSDVADLPEGGDWYEFTITPPIVIDATKALWLGCHYEAIAPNIYPGAMDGGPAIAGFGDLISSSGTNFTSIYQQNEQLNGNWCLMGYVENAKGEPAIISRASVQEYKITRNGAPLASVAASYLTYKDEDLALGEYRYGISASYTNGCVSDEVLASKIVIDDCNPPQNLLAAQPDPNVARVTLNWEDPKPVPEKWVQWCNNPKQGYGIGGVSSIQVAARFSPEDLNAYEAFDGTDITTFRFVLEQQLNTTVKIWVGGDGTNPGTEIFSQTIPKEDIEVNVWNSISISGLKLDISQYLWIGYSYTGAVSGTFPASCDAGPAVDGKGNLIKQNGSWVSLLTLISSANRNWCLSLLVKDKNGKSVDLNRAAVKSFRVYRDDTFLKQTQGNIHTYIDQSAGLQLGNVYKYCVTALYDNDCESEIDVMCQDIDLKLSARELTNSVAVFPNPANDVVKITGENMTKVEIYNTIGQLVEVKTGDLSQINVSTFNAGIYFLKVYDANNNSITKRIMISGK